MVIYGMVFSVFRTLNKKNGFLVHNVFSDHLRVIYQTRATVFHRNIPTQRRELKILRIFLTKSKCLDS